MFPWTHLAVGYLLYTIWTRLRFRRAPADGPTVALGVGTQFPDLVDKPLHLVFGIFDGRAIGHSLLTILPLCLALLTVGIRYGYVRHATAFGIGALSHLLGDARTAIMLGQVEDNAAYLFWPLLPAPTYPQDSITDHLGTISELLSEIDPSAPATLVTTQLGFGLVLSAFLLTIWLYDGAPGLGSLRWVVRRVA